VFAKNPGTTQVNLWDSNKQLYTVDVTVLADAREIEGILANQLPLASLKVLPLSNSAIISGHVTNVDDVDRAVAIVEQFFTTVVNNIKVVGVQQVLLHTRIMEVSRTKLRDLGVDLAFQESRFTILNGPGDLLSVVSGTTDGFLPQTGVDPTNLRINTGGFEGMIRALYKQNLVKLLAEPTVVATHGRPARFTVGGRIPYTIPSGNGTVSVQYEDYGTTVDFLPFVVGPGRIRLEVRPEVSEVDESRSLVLQGTNVTAFTTRYVETAVELQAGQTFALAGLLQSRTESELQSTPLLGSIPIIGAAFRRVKESKNDIELLMTITPELVDAMDPHEVPPGGPGLNSQSPDDHDLYMNGHIEVPRTDGYCGETAGLPAMINDPSCLPAESYPAGTFPTQVPGMPMNGIITQGGVSSGVAMPPGAVTPGTDPMVVGEGVILSQPR
ncbi:MAG: histidine kinase, partial [Planctomycetota bacterium]